MAAIVATMVYWPVWVVLVVLCALLGLKAQTYLSFGGALGTFSGMAAWWLLAFAMALPYAACVFPWELKMDESNEHDAKGEPWLKKN